MELLVLCEYGGQICERPRLNLNLNCITTNWTRSKISFLFSPFILIYPSLKNTSPIIVSLNIIIMASLNYSEADEIEWGM